MDNTFLHIITSKVPDRYSYDGAADLFWKITAFQKAGIECILHIIDSPSAIPIAIRAHCSKIDFYERSKGHASFSFSSPIFVNRMFNPKLLSRLLEDDYPIYFDGIQTSYYLTFPIISKRLHFLHIGNTDVTIQSIFKNTKDSFSIKIVKLFKSIIYVRYRKKIYTNAWLLSEFTPEKLSSHGEKMKYLEFPSFIGLPISRNLKGVGSYCLLHGDFKNSITCNFAIWLLDSIFSEIEIPLVIAGKSPSNKLELAAHRKLHTCMVADPSEGEMTELISKSQICIHLDSNDKLHDHGIILSLQYGRHILKIDEECILSGKLSKEELIKKIQKVFVEPFGEDYINLRERDLTFLSQDVVSTQRIKDIIHAHCQ